MLTSVSGSYKVSVVFISGRNLFPDNIIQACTMHAHTKRSEVKVTEEVSRELNINASQLLLQMNSNSSQTVVTTELIYRDGMNTMGVSINGQFVFFVLMFN